MRLRLLPLLLSLAFEITKYFNIETEYHTSTATPTIFHEVLQHNLALEHDCTDYRPATFGFT
jgi:hypothetical protein